ncbi:MAG TPA: ABC transporter ATP-binding protein [Vicinamibacteria bacterium]|nr:ABC transporter ATP-binding protein [Vicinamibacteria bacterium]
MPSSSPAFEARRVTKRFGRLTALREVDLALEPARCHVVFGRNGAGKSTLLGIAATLLKPTSGELFFDGRPLDDLRDAVRHRLGFVSHESLLYPDLTVSENLAFYAKLYGVDADVEATLTWADLELRRRTPTRNLSRGMTQRLAIARALLHRPSLLLLDEPFTGLDTVSSDRLSDRIKSLRRDTTVLLTTHDVDRGVAIADRILLMESGRIATDATGASSADVRRLLAG